MINANSTDQTSTVGVIEPVAGASTYETVYIKASDAYNYKCLVTSGTVGTSVDAKIEQAVDSSGTSVKDLTGSSITQLTAAGSATIQFKASDLDSANNFDYFRLSITTVGASTVAAGVVEAINPRYAPLADAAKIDEVVTV